MFIVALLLAFVWLAAHFTLALGRQRDIRPVFTMQNGVQISLPGVAQLRMLVQLAALALAVVVGLFASTRWDVWLAWQHGQPFNTADPILGYDVGFYVFSLPFFRVVLGICQFLIVLTALGCAGLYFITGHLNSSLRIAHVHRGQAAPLPARRRLPPDHRDQRLSRTRRVSAAAEYPHLRRQLYRRARAECRWRCC